MDWVDDGLDFFSEESEAFFSKMDDDLNQALALSLQEGAADSNGKLETFLNKMDEDSDFAFALSLQEEMEKETRKSSSPPFSKSTSIPLGIVDEQWEVLDPTPDIRALFLQFNDRFFYRTLDGVEVKWSPRMYLCAGVCSYEGRGGLCSVRLSLPLLKLRPRRDLVETLLHEMIHAYLFVTASNRDHDAHGPEFRKHMKRINQESGTNITVYHNFHDEVDVYRKHIWKCNGPCQNKRPFYGYVKRAINRTPGPRDPWWAGHMSTCGGTFTKVSEPEGYQKKSTKTNQPVKRKPFKDTDNQLSNIKKFLKNPSSTAVSKDVSSSSKNHSKIAKGKEGINLTENKNPVNTLHSSSVTALPSIETNNVTAFTGQGFLVGSSSNAAPKTFLASVRREIASSSTVPKTFPTGVHREKASSSTVPKTFLASVRREIASSSTVPKTFPTGVHHEKASSSTVPKTFLANVRREIASSLSAPPKAFATDAHQETGSSGLKNSTQTFSNNSRSIQKESCVLGDQNSLWNNVENRGKPVNNPQSNKTTPNMLKKPSYVQSSLEKFVTSPSRPVVGNNIKGSTKDSSANVSPKVNCPVCFKLFPNSEINAHLDSCLLASS